MPNCKEMLVFTEIRIKSLMITKLLHIHMGFNTPLTPDQIDRIICLCDLFLGLPSYIYDKDEERRKLYGAILL